MFGASEIIMVSGKGGVDTTFNVDLISESNLYIGI
jgi:hypothetical protein